MFKNLNTFGFLTLFVSALSRCDTAWTGTYIIITAKRRDGKGKQVLSPSWLYLCFSFSKEKEFSTLKNISFICCSCCFGIINIMKTNQKIEYANHATLYGEG